nr:uncharacterized mitochondrial protein AtMg00810-like [Tanacetum cinerariifolium]
GVYPNDDWNEVKLLLWIELRLTLVTAKAKNINREAQIHAKVDGKKTSVYTEVVADEVVYEEMYNSMEKATTTATSLDAEHDMGIIRDAAAQTRSQRVSKFSNDPPLLRVNTLGSREDRLQLKELMELYTKLSERVLNMEITKTTQAKKISSLKRRLERLEKKKKSRTHGLKRLYKGRNIADIDADAKTTLVDENEKDQGRYNDQEMFDTGVLVNEEVVVEKAVAVKEVDAAQDQVSAATTTTAKDLIIDDITMAKALEALKTSKPKIKGIVLKNKSIDEVQKAFDKTMSWINSFVSMDTEVVKDIVEGSEIRAEESSKGVGMDLQQESTKKQKVDNDQEADELKRCLDIVLNDEDDVTINATPFSSKSLTIIDYKIHKEGRKSYFQIIKADGSSQIPDIMQAVCYFARYQARLSEKHLEEVKRIFRYLRGTINMGLWYLKDSGFELTAFSNANHTECIDSRKITSRGIQFLGDKLVTWMSKKQDCTAMSSTEAEYVSLSASYAQVITEYQLADMFTKSLPEDRFQYIVRRIGMRCLTSAELEALATEST